MVKDAVVRGPVLVQLALDRDLGPVLVRLVGLVALVPERDGDLGFAENTQQRSRTDLSSRPVPGREQAIYLLSVGLDERLGACLASRARSPAAEDEDDSVHHGALAAAVEAEDEVDAVVQVELEERVALEVLERDVLDDASARVGVKDESGHRRRLLGLNGQLDPASASVHLRTGVGRLVLLVLAAIAHFSLGHVF